MLRVTRRIVERAGAVTAVVLIGVIGLSAPASATWSIIAVDPETGLVGAAMASCVPADVLGNPGETLVPVVLVPTTRSVGVVQATIDPRTPVELRRLLGDGADATLAIEELLADDEQPTVRQYAVATAGEGDGPPVVGHNGADVEGPAAQVIGAVDAGSDRVAVQGFLLADAEVVDRALEAFVASRAQGRSLDRALVDALVAGSELGGDRRCEDDQTALFAHLAVAEPDDDPFRPSLVLTVTVDEGDGRNPVTRLSRHLEEGRTGWIDDGGADDPVGIPRILVMGVGALLAVGAAVAFRIGLGSPSARR